MRIGEYVHQIRIDFQVTPEVQRYVYVYLLIGEKCCLIDAGVAGSEAVISAYMKKGNGERFAVHKWNFRNG